MPTTRCAPYAANSDRPGGSGQRLSQGTGEASEAFSGLHVLLCQPEIPQNTGNVARTCAATHTPLHLVEPLGFRVTDRHLKRAGLDYWPHVSCRIHKDLDSFTRDFQCLRLVCFSSRAARSYLDFCFSAGDCLVFGSETKGLPDEVLALAADRVLRIPIDRSRVRSLNLATSVGAALFEALRQVGTAREDFWTHSAALTSPANHSGGTGQPGWPDIACEH